MFPRKSVLISLIALVFSLVLFVMPTHADTCSDSSDACLSQISAQISDLNHALQLSQNATKPLEGQLSSLQAQLASIRANIQHLSVEITQKEKDLNAREDQIAQEQVLLDARVKSYYIRSYSTDPLTVIFSSQNSADLFRQLTYTQVASAQDQQVITTVTNQVLDLQTQKVQLEKSKASLAAFQVQVDANAKFLDGQITQAKAYQSTLTSQIAQLSAKQQALIAAKQSSLGIPLYANALGSCSSDLTNGKPVPFSPAFGFFTYGVRNRVGLNQYGALGRAQAGQSSDQILRAYYNFDSYQPESNPTIRVNDSNNYDQGNIIWSGPLEDYLKRIYEVPGNWPLEALKAQVIAARSYVLAETNNGNKSICANQNCQVFQTNDKGGTWDQAVDATAGQAMVQGGSVITAYFSSTHGGFTHSSGGDISSRGWLKNAQDSSSNISSFSDLQNNAYDKDSPWFYCDWGSRSQYSGTAWLKPAEVADIANAIMLIQSDNSTAQYLSSTDSGAPGVWDESRVRQELQNRGITPFANVANVSVSADFGSGKTTGVTITGDAGTKTFTGDTFTTYFDLRAPGNIFIPPFAGSPGNFQAPLFNVEQK